MANKFITALALLLLATAANAQTVVEILPPSKAAAVKIDRPALDPSTPSASGFAHKAERPSSLYILPHFRIDTEDPGGDSTLIGIRNEHNATQIVTVQYHPSNSSTPLVEQQRSMDSKEVWTVNLRDVLGGQVADSDGFIRGWARISADAPITADYFQATPSEAFAFGEIPIDIDAGEFCEAYKVRFLLGGGFSGGTVITFMLDLPLGGNTMLDPPSVTGTAYDEAGNMVNNFNIWTDDFSFQLNASTLVNEGTNFGSLDFRFENVDDGFGGGAASVTHDASGLFSVGLKGFCLDAP